MISAGAGKGRTVGTSRGAAKLQPLALALVAAGLLAGCGGSSSGPNEGPAAKFLGRWERDASTMFSITCVTPAGVTDISAMYNPWSEIQFERGVLSDASETSSVCSRPPGLSLDVQSGSSLSVTLPNDPYTGMAPECVAQIGTDPNGIPVYLDLTFTTFKFTLLAPVKDKAPTAMLELAATGPIVQDDGTGMNFVIVDNCTYSGANDTYHRMSQP